MHRPFSLLAVACVLAACSPSKAPDSASSERPAEPSQPATNAEKPAAEDRDRTHLTIYSGDYDALGNAGSPAPDMPGYALVERPLQYTLAAGSNAISATNVPPAMDVEAAMLRPRQAGVTLQAQRYVGALASTGDVLARAVGRRIAVEHTSGGAKQTDSGTLLAAEDGLSLALSDGRIKVIRDYDSFSIIDAGDRLPQEAALQWTAQAKQAGEARFMLDYPMGGMAWRAEYRATLAADKDCSLSLDGAALVNNRSGVTFDNARLTLVAGEPERAQSPITRYKDYYGSAMAADAAASPAGNAPTRRTSGEYHAYDLPGATRIGDRAVERVPLFTPRPAVACERVYTTTAGNVDWMPPVPQTNAAQHGPTGPQPVMATVSFDNSKEAGLGQPLPAGRVRVFDDNDFLGESSLDHTPSGNEVRLEVGKAFDLTANREATDFRLDRAGRTITESFAITLRNAKSGDATVRVIEPLQRWSDWDIVASSLTPAKKDAQTVEFEVPVPAKGETRLTYTVRYRWPQDMKP